MEIRVFYLRELLGMCFVLKVLMERAQMSRRDETRLDALSGGSRKRQVS